MFMGTLCLCVREKDEYLGPVSTEEVFYVHLWVCLYSKWF